MKKNYTLKITLAVLVVVLVSLVSFVGAFKGKKLVKEYSLGKDLGERKIVTYTAMQNPEYNENGEIIEKSEEEMKKDYIKAKNIVEKRLAEVNPESGNKDYEVRLDEENGTIQLEVPSDIDKNFLQSDGDYFFYNIMKKGKIEIVNRSTGEVIVDSNGFKSASARIEKAKTTKPTVQFNIKFTKDAVKKLKEANTKNTDADGNETDAEFVVRLDGSEIYPESGVTAAEFVETTKNGILELAYKQSDDENLLKQEYEETSLLVATINAGVMPVEYSQGSTVIVKSNINIKTIILVACIVAAGMFLYALYKCKTSAVLPMISLVGLVASILLVLRYTNVKITLFTILGLAIVVIANYLLILKTLSNEKSFKENMIDTLLKFIPCIIIAIVFCCSPFIQVASLGMAMFWGTIVSAIYNILITRVFINK